MSACSWATITFSIEKCLFLSFHSYTWQNYLGLVLVSFWSLIIFSFFIVLSILLPTYTSRQGLYSSGWPQTFCIAKADLLEWWVSATTPSIHSFVDDSPVGVGLGVGVGGCLLLTEPLGICAFMDRAFHLDFSCIYFCTQWSLTFPPHFLLLTLIMSFLFFSQSIIHLFYWSCQRIETDFINEVQLILFLLG